MAVLKYKERKWHFNDNKVQLLFLFACLLSCETLLYEFLKSIRNEPTALDMPLLTNILVQHANSPNELIQFTAIDWIREFVQLSGANMLEHASGIFTAILPCLAYEGEPRKSKKLTILWVLL